MEAVEGVVEIGEQTGCVRVQSAEVGDLESGMFVLLELPVAAYWE
jgi:hypothetical protein